MKPLLAAAMTVAIIAALIIMPHPSLAQNPIVAYCNFVATASAPQLTGSISFQYDYSTLTTNVTANILWSGFVDGQEYGMHIYQYGDITDTTGAIATGPIFSVTGEVQHGCPPSNLRREGDMGNWTATGGVIRSTMRLNKIMMISWGESIIGRSVVLRAGPDNCTGEDGYSGGRLAQCVIGIANVENNIATHADPVDTAVCVLQRTSDSYCDGSACTGTVWLQQQSNGVLITASVYGLKMNSAHGFHVHQYGDWSSNLGLNFGTHFNPNNNAHGMPTSATSHMGDLGNIQSYSTSGVAWYQYLATNIPSISQLVGRSIVVHSMADNGAGNGCDATGNSGTRIIGGIIGLANPNTTVPAIPAGVVINNNWNDTACVIAITSSPLPPQPSTGGISFTTLEIVAIVGWALAISVLTLNAIVIYFCYCRGSKSRYRRGDYEDVGDYSPEMDRRARSRSYGGSPPRRYR